MYARPSPEVFEPNVEFARRHTVLSKFRPVQPQTRVPLFVARTLNATGQLRATLSLQQEMFYNSSLRATAGGKGADIRPTLFSQACDDAADR